MALATPGDNIIIETEVQTLVIPTPQLAGLIISTIPKGFTDPNSPEARDELIIAVRLLVKGFVRFQLPKLLKRTFGPAAPSMPKGVDPVLWFLQLTISLALAHASREPWKIEAHEIPSTNAQSYWQVTNLSTGTAPATTPSADA